MWNNVNEVFSWMLSPILIQIWGMLGKKITILTKTGGIWGKSHPFRKILVWVWWKWSIEVASRGCLGGKAVSAF